MRRLREAISKYRNQDQDQDQDRVRDIKVANAFTLNQDQDQDQDPDQDQDQIHDRGTLQENHAQSVGQAMSERLKIQDSRFKADGYGGSYMEGKKELSLIQVIRK